MSQSSSTANPFVASATGVLVYDEDISSTAGFDNDSTTNISVTAKPSGKGTPENYSRAVDDENGSDGVETQEMSHLPSDHPSPSSPITTTAPAALPREPSNTPSDDDDEETVDPLSPTTMRNRDNGGGNRGLFLNQFGAAMMKNIHQKRRAPVQCFFEVILPVIFLFGLVAIWLASNEANLSGEQPVSYDSTYPSLPSQLLASACSDPAGTQPVNGLPLCNDAAFQASVRAALNVSSGVALNFTDPFANPNRRYLPPAIVDIRFAIPLVQTAFLYAASIGMRVHSIPTLDEYIVLQWAIASSGVKPNGRSTRTSIIGLAIQGQLFVSPNTASSTAFVNYVNSTSKLFRYICDGSDTLATAKSRATADENEGRSWGILDLRSLEVDNLDFDIQLNRTALPDTTVTIIPKYGGGYPSDGLYKNQLYLSSGYLTLQRLVLEYHTTQIEGLPSPPIPVMSPMGFGEYKDQAFLLQAGDIAPLIIVLAFLYPVSQLVKRIVLEKELRVREAMMIMGLGTTSFYLSWILTYALQFLLTAILMTVITVNTITPKSDPIIVFFIYYLFCLTAIGLSAAMSAFFSKSRIAALVSPFLFLIFSMPMFAIDNVPPAGQIPFMLLSPSAFAICLGNLFRHEIGNGLGNPEFVSARDDVNTALAFFFYALDFVIYIFIMLYVDAVMPNDWGTPSHPLFFIIDPIRALIRCCGGGDKSSKERDEELEYDTRDPNGTFEDADPAAMPAVRVRGLVKEFQRGDETFRAVDGVQWNLEENQVSVLLGHNGAGKTTIINLMTGMLAPDAGDCEIFGHSIRDDLWGARSEIGFCPQHNILWPELTCDEHLRFYARLKGITGKEQDDMVESMLHSVDLWDKRDQQSDTLSGGQKRKLSVAISFVGGSRLVFLDEPTAGMDVAARRFTWDLIKTMSVGRVIVLTTHFMDEADLLGNSISIMSKGRLKTSGTSAFLKSNLGVGYSLALSLEAHTDHSHVVAAVREYISDADELGSAPGELGMRLPLARVSEFPPLLRMLEDKGADMGVRGFGVALTTLEEIFLKIAHDDELQHALAKQEEAAAKLTNVADGAAAVEVEAEQEEMTLEEASQSVWNVTVVEGESAMFAHQMKAMLWKRFHNARRDRRTQCLQIVFPVVCVMLAMLMGLLNFESFDVIVMNPSIYEEASETLVSNCDTLFNIPARGGASAIQSQFASSDVTVTDISTLTSGIGLSERLIEDYRKHDKLRFTAMYCSDSSASNIFTLNSPANVSLLMYNLTSVHEPGITQLQYYRQFTLGNNKPNAVLKNSLVVLPLSSKEEALYNGIRTVLTAIIIMIPFTFIPSTFVGWIVKEREIKARHLQNVSGARFFVYWLSNLIFDILSFFLSEILVILVFVIFWRTEYIGSGENFGAIFLLFIFYGLAGIAISYLISFAFEEHSTAQNIVMIGNFICGFLLVMAVYILSIIESTKDIAVILQYIFRVIPSFCLGDGIINLATLKVLQDFGYTDRPFDLDYVGWNLIYMAIEFPIFFALTLFIDHPSRRTRTQKLFHNPDTMPEEIEDEDEDVAEERRAIEANERPEDLVQVRHMRKVYPNGKVAVRNITFGVHPGEVFGFLGTNGAGKTTTISILCQEFLPTNGRASIAGFDLVDDSKSALQVIGYCPQFDALLDLLTPTEHLELYAGVRGIIAEDAKRVVRALIRICELVDHRDTLAMNLSGGNRRKLSVAISLLGGPRVVFLDEPSAGMDPVARRGLWKAIEMIADNCAVVLTTHHLEEVEALANRVAIMVDGTVRCIGDKTHLKSKYGSGFEMIVKLKDIPKDKKKKSKINANSKHHEANIGEDGEEVDADRVGLETFISETMPEAELTEERNRRFTFKLPQNTKLSKTFELLSEAEKRLHVSSYSVSQTSIESVFMRISAEAEEQAHMSKHAEVSTPTADEDGNSKPVNEPSSTTSIPSTLSASNRHRSSTGQTATTE